MDIPAPRRTIDDPHYNVELQEALDFPVLDFVDRIGAAGWNKREAFKALAEVIHNQARAYEEDPDPDDEPSEYAGDDDRLVKGFVEGRKIRP